MPVRGVQFAATLRASGGNKNTRILGESARRAKFRRFAFLRRRARVAASLRDRRPARPRTGRPRRQHRRGAATRASSTLSESRCVRLPTSSPRRVEARRAHRPARANSLAVCEGRPPERATTGAMAHRTRHLEPHLVVPQHECRDRDRGCEPSGGGADTVMETDDPVVNTPATRRTGGGLKRGLRGLPGPHGGGHHEFAAAAAATAAAPRDDGHAMQRALSSDEFVRRTVGRKSSQAGRPPLQPSPPPTQGGGAAVATRVDRDAHTREEAADYDYDEDPDHALSSVRRDSGKRRQIDPASASLASASASSSSSSPSPAASLHKSASATTDHRRLSSPHRVRPAPGLGGGGGESVAGPGLATSSAQHARTPAGRAGVVGARKGDAAPQGSKLKPVLPGRRHSPSASASASASSSSSSRATSPAISQPRGSLGTKSYSYGTGTGSSPAHSADEESAAAMQLCEPLPSAMAGSGSESYVPSTNAGTAMLRGGTRSAASATASSSSSSSSSSTNTTTPMAYLPAAAAAAAPAPTPTPILCPCPNPRGSTLSLHAHRLVLPPCVTPTEVVACGGEAAGRALEAQVQGQPEVLDHEVMFREGARDDEVEGGGYVREDGVHCPVPVPAATASAASSRRTSLSGEAKKSRRSLSVVTTGSLHSITMTMCTTATTPTTTATTTTSSTGSGSHHPSVSHGSSASSFRTAAEETLPSPLASPGSRTVPARPLALGAPAPAHPPVKVTVHPQRSVSVPYLPAAHDPHDYGTAVRVELGSAAEEAASARGRDLAVPPPRLYRSSTSPGAIPTAGDQRSDDDDDDDDHDDNDETKDDDTTLKATAAAVRPPLPTYTSFEDAFGIPRPPSPPPTPPPAAAEGEGSANANGKSWWQL